MGVRIPLPLLHFTDLHHMLMKVFYCCKLRGSISFTMHKKRKPLAGFLFLRVFIFFKALILSSDSRDPSYDRFVYRKRREFALALVGQHFSH